MSYPLLEIQEALYGVLSADTALASLVSGVYDHVPSDASYPFVAIEDVQADNWSYQGGRGVRARFELVVYSRYHGKAECHSVLERIDALLNEVPLTVSGVTIVQVQVNASRVTKLNDGHSFRGRLELQLLAHEAI